MGKKWKGILLLLLSFTLLTGCGAGSAASEAAYYDGGNYAPAMAEEAAADGDYFYDGEYKEEYETGSFETVSTEKTVDAPEILTEDKLVYTCNLSMETTEYADTVAKIREKIKAYGGIIESEQENDSDYDWYYEDHLKTHGTMSLYLTIRVPSEKYEAFVGEISEFGKVKSKSQNVENISRQYHDTEARIEALTKEEGRLTDMLDQADTIEDMIYIEERLTEVEAQLNSYKTNLAQMDVDVRYSTINLNLSEVLVYTKESPSPITFGQRIAATFKRSIRAFGTFWEDILHALIYLLPFLVCALIIFLIVLAIRRKMDPRTPEERKRDRKLAKEAKEAQKKAKREAKRNAKYAGMRPMPQGQQPQQNMPQLQSQPQQGQGTPDQAGPQR